ncbi:MAG: PKD domain-containing protein [Pseudomonadota bacterium]
MDRAYRLLIFLLFTQAGFATGAQDFKPRFSGSHVAATISVPQIDTAALKSASVESDGPIRYSVVHSVEQVLNVPTDLKGVDAVSWQINAPGAVSLDLVLSDFWVPRGVAVFVYGADKAWIRGPFTDQHNYPSGVLPVPFVPGELATIELVGSAELLPHARLRLRSVGSAFRKLWAAEDFAKSGACNVDVACPAGDGWSNQIASVANYTFQKDGGGFRCSGQLLNTTANNDNLFSTGLICLGADQDDLSTVASTIVAYFNYQSASCRAPGSVANGTEISRDDFSDTVSGASLVASYPETDLVLTRLNDTPSESYAVFYSGWDRSGNPETGAASIHHAFGDEKRINLTASDLCQTEFGGFCGDQGNYWRVNSWDSGTLEAGSSGAGLWNTNRLFIGQLRNAQTACIGSGPTDNDRESFYGRLDVSWSGGGTSSSRVSDWLDPNNTGALRTGGRGGCEGPQVDIVSNKGSVLQAGESAVFSANVSGGQGALTYAWDVDADGVTDSTISTANVVYHDAYTGTVRLTVTDATNCSTESSFGAVVQAPVLELSNVGAPSEVCGDGDAHVDPGESWSYPVTVRNSGSADAVDAYAAFSIDTLAPAAKRSGGRDNFGYSFSDSSTGLCPISFQDIASDANRLTFNPTFNGISALDDGWVEVALGGSGFDFYGDPINVVTMSSNGYITTDIQIDDGGDFVNDCPLPAVPGEDFTAGARFYPLHDDLILADAFHQYFPTCPRPGDAAGSTGCDIFQWNVAEFFDQPVTGGTLNVQAILYEGTHQIVYQYRGTNPKRGESQTVGIQNELATDGLTYACNQADSIVDNSAVCFYHPQSTTPGLSSNLTLDQSIASLGNLPAGGSAQASVTLEFQESFACGDGYSLSYAGAAHNGGFSQTDEGSILSGTVPADCNVVSSCQTPDQPGAQPRQGFWFNAQRPGNGIELHFAGDGMYSAWYTADRKRLPIWYYVQTLNGQRLVNDTVTADILKFNLAGDIRQNSPTSQVVGQAQISFINDSEAVMTWTVDGIAGGEKLTFFDLSSEVVDPVITDQYFNPSEGGWGLGTHRQGAQEFSAIYFYDTAGEPRWVVVASDGEVLASQGDADLASFKVHCPGCAWTSPAILNGGTLTRTLNADGSATLDNLDVSIEGEVQIDWERTNLPLQQVTPP